MHGTRLIKAFGRQHIKLVKQLVMSDVMKSPFGETYILNWTTGCWCLDNQRNRKRLGGVFKDDGAFTQGVLEKILHEAMVASIQSSCEDDIAEAIHASVDDA